MSPLDGDEPSDINLSATLAPTNTMRKSAVLLREEADCRLIEHGYEPVAAIGKAAVGDGWSTRSNTPEAVRAERAALGPEATNTGLRTGHLAGLDIDLHNPDHAQEIAAIAAVALDGFDAMERVGSKGMMLCYRNETPIAKIIVSGTAPDAKPGDKAERIEILGMGQQFIAYGLHPDTGNPYRWLQADVVGEPLTRPLAELPEVTPPKLRDFAQRAREKLAEWGYTNVRVSDSGDPERTAAVRRARSERAPVREQELVDRLRFLDPSTDRQRWIGYLAAIRSTNLMGIDDPDAMDDELLDIACAWSRGEHADEGITPANYVDDDDVATAFYSLDPDQDGGAHFGTLDHDARAAGFTGRPAGEPTMQEVFAPAIARLAVERPDDTPPDNAIETPIGSDDHLALAFEEAYRSKLLFVPEWGKWFGFGTARWEAIAVATVWNMIRRIARDLAKGLDTDGLQRQMASKQRISGAECLCRGSMLAPAASWDAEPYQLNTPGGIVDLRTGLLNPSVAAARCIKMTAVAPGGECPRWRKFLAEVTDGDAELQAYLQRLVGYSLIGRVEEHVLAFLYGTGGNGKGVFLNTVAGILSDYATNAPMDAFTETMSDRHPTDMAMLQGARFVTAQETEAGRAWAEAKVKALTGGDPVTARYMRQDFFTYTPQFTLVIAGNHKPRLHHVDEAMRRRMHMVPFTVKVSNPDIHLAERLKAEWPGILRWAIDGCVEWQRVGGLHPPQAVVDLTAAYLSAEDPTGGVVGCVLRSRSPRK